MDKRSEEVLNRFSQETQSRSRLEPHRDLILKLRKKGATYRRISELLEEEFGLKTYYGTVYWFIKRRTGKKKQDEPEIEAQNEAIPPEPGKPTVGGKPKLSPEELAAQREAIRAAFTKPAPEVKPEYRFTFDESKPLTNRKY